MLCVWFFRILFREKVMILCYLVDCRYVLWFVKVKYIVNNGNWISVIILRDIYIYNVFIWIIYSFLLKIFNMKLN